MKRGVGLNISLGAHGQHHLDSLETAWRRLRQQPLASLLSILVIGIALSLPTGLFLLVSNLDRAATGLSSQTEITAFLKADINESGARAVADRVSAEEGVRRVRFVSREEGLNELQRSGLDDVLTSLTGNPLPHALVIEPNKPNPTLLTQLAQRIESYAEVDAVSRVGEWVRRLNALLEFGVGLTWLLGAIFAFALAVIIGNTIRLQIYARREEIEISRLIGATDRFIRRPFLYFGTLQGLCGGLTALFITGSSLFWLNRSVAELASTYDSTFQLANVDLPTGLALLLSAGLLGLLGAWLSVAYTLRDFE